MPNTYFVGEPSKTVSGGVVTYTIPYDGAVKWLDSAGTEMLSLAPVGSTIKLGGTQLTSTAAELNIVDNKIASFGMVATAAASTICEVAITGLDAAGVTIARPHIFTVFLSDASTGAGLTGTSASGTVTFKTSSGIILSTLVSKKALLVQSLATGVFTLEITDSAKTAFYVCATADTGRAATVLHLATADYGA